MFWYAKRWASPGLALNVHSGISQSEYGLFRESLSPTAMILIWISCRWAWPLSHFLVFQEPQKEDTITLRRCGIWICNATLCGQGSTLTHSIYHVGHKVWPGQKELQFSGNIESILVADEKNPVFHALVAETRDWKMDLSPTQPGETGICMQARPVLAPMRWAA